MCASHFPEISFSQNEKKGADVPACHGVGARRRARWRETVKGEGPRKNEGEKCQREKEGKTESQTNWFTAVCPFEC